MKAIMNDEVMERLIDTLMELQKKESTDLPLLKKQLAETEKGINNMLNYIQAGIFTPSTKQRLDELEETKSQLEVSILQEEMHKPLLTREQIAKALKLYVITDRSWLKEDETLLSVCEKVIQNGATFLQLREKELGAEETRKEHIVQSAISTLSYSELEAIIHIFDELDGSEGILVASKIADRVGITRSVIVNALRKFESAGVIESRSSGMKGTYIKVVNDYVFTELEHIKEEKNRG